MEMEAERVRQGTALGRSAPLRLLFDHFVAAALAGERLTEIGIATDVFGKPADCDLSQEATVRVYVHRLRRKLAAYYDASHHPKSARLLIPKGEYRIILSGDAPFDPVARNASPPRRLPWAAMLAIAIVVNALVWWLAWPRPLDAVFVQARSRAPWAQLFANDRPVTIVVGDYYIFGERDPANDVDRLVRDYSINSVEDLDQYLMEHPELSDKLQNLNLSYLPVASAFALRELLPVIVGADRERVATRVIAASQLTPQTLKLSNIVYVGYFSGLGILRDPVFAASRFSVGESWDEIVDDRSGRRFVSSEGGAGRANAQSRDYGYLSSFQGLGGNRVIVIAGARDMGVRQIAEAVTGLNSLDELARKTGAAQNFEVLYEVEGINRQNLGASVVIAAPIAPHDRQQKVFPSR